MFGVRLKGSSSVREEVKESSECEVTEEVGMNGRNQAKEAKASQAIQSAEEGGKQGTQGENIQTHSCEIYVKLDKRQT